MSIHNYTEYNQNGENQTIRRTGVCINRCFHFSPLKYTLPNRHISITRSTMLRTLLRTFNSLLCPSPPPTTSITADDFATFFTEETKAISSQFSPPLTQDLQPTRSTAQTPIFSFCPLTEAEVSKLLSSHPTTCPLGPIPSHLLQAISPTLLPALTHTINTSLLTGIFPTAFKQARVTPLLKKTYIKHFSFRKLQSCLSPSIHCQNTRTSCLQPGLIVSFTEQQTGC